MAKIQSAILEVRRLDTLSQMDSAIHRLDPRAKLLTTLVFIVTVVSADKYEISGLLPFVFYPVCLVAIANLPGRYLLRKLAIVCPFALLVGIANPFLDRQPLALWDGVWVSGGWVSFASIVIRFALTVGSALVLVATTSFHGVCLAMHRLGVPSVMVTQLLMLHRYIFVLTEEAARSVRAHALRSFQSQGLGVSAYGSLAGHLLLRTLDRAQRIHLAMLSRGFEGTFRQTRPLRIGWAEVVFTAGWSAAFILMRIVNWPRWLGDIVVQVLS